MRNLSYVTCLNVPSPDVSYRSMMFDSSTSSADRQGRYIIVAVVEPQSVVVEPQSAKIKEELPLSNSCVHHFLFDLKVARARWPAPCALCASFALCCL